MNERAKRKMTGQREAGQEQEMGQEKSNETFVMRWKQRGEGNCAPGL